MWPYPVRNRNSLPSSSGLPLTPWAAELRGWRWGRLCACALICRLGDCHQSVSRDAPGIQSSQQHCGWDQTETHEGVSRLFMCGQYSDKEDAFEKLQNTAKKTVCCLPTPKPLQQEAGGGEVFWAACSPPQRMAVGCCFRLFSRNLHKHCHPSRTSFAFTAVGVVLNFTFCISSAHLQGSMFPPSFLPRLHFILA